MKKIKFQVNETSYISFKEPKDKLKIHKKTRNDVLEIFDLSTKCVFLKIH